MSQKMYVVVKLECGKYLFETPVCLDAGTNVIVQTKHGEQVGICCTSDFTAYDSPEFFKLWGTTGENMKEVIGKMNIERFCDE